MLSNSTIELASKAGREITFDPGPGHVPATPDSVISLKDALTSIGDDPLLVSDLIDEVRDVYVIWMCIPDNIAPTDSRVVEACDRTTGIIEGALAMIDNGSENPPVLSAMRAFIGEALLSVARTFWSAASFKKTADTEALARALASPDWSALSTLSESVMSTSNDDAAVIARYVFHVAYVLR
jgi:hypothetical protein